MSVDLDYYGLINNSVSLNLESIIKTNKIHFKNKNVKFCSGIEINGSCVTVCQLY